MRRRREKRIGVVVARRWADGRHSKGKILFQTGFTHVSRKLNEKTEWDHHQYSFDYLLPSRFLQHPLEESRGRREDARVSRGRLRPAAEAHVAEEPPAALAVLAAAISVQPPQHPGGGLAAILATRLLYLITRT